VSVTPLDILHKDFRRSLRGYREREVQEFLRQIAETLEQALTTSAELREKVQSLERRLLHYEKIEETMQNALVLAQKSAEDTRRGSQKQAEVILADAEQKRQQVLSDAQSRGAEVEREYSELRQQRRRFEMEFRVLLQLHLRMLEDGTDRAAEAPPLPPPEAPQPPVDSPELDAQTEDPRHQSILDWTRLGHREDGAAATDEEEDELPTLNLRGDRALVQ